VISYYNKIVDFSIDIAKRTFMWGVPFEYNSTRIDDGKVRVHEEVIISTALLKSMNPSSFNMTMNNRLHLSFPISTRRQTDHSRIIQ
jgi:hypothetical protein